MPVSDENRTDYSGERGSARSLKTRISLSLLLISCGFSLLGTSGLFMREAHAVGQGVCPELYRALLYYSQELEEVESMFKKFTMAGCVEAPIVVDPVYQEPSDLAAVQAQLTTATESSPFSDQTPNAESTQFGVSMQDKFRTEEPILAAPQ